MHFCKLMWGLGTNFQLNRLAYNRIVGGSNPAKISWTTTELLREVRVNTMSSLCMHGKKVSLESLNHLLKRRFVRVNPRMQWSFRLVTFALSFVTKRYLSSGTLYSGSKSGEHSWWFHFLISDFEKIFRLPSFTSKKLYYLWFFRLSPKFVS